MSEVRPFQDIAQDILSESEAPLIQKYLLKGYKVTYVSINAKTIFLSGSRDPGVDRPGTVITSDVTLYNALYPRFTQWYTVVRFDTNELDRRGIAIQVVTQISTNPHEVEW